MFANESRKTWIAFCLLGASAVLFLIRSNAASHSLRTYTVQAADLLLAATVITLVWPPRNLSRTFAEIHADIRRGRQKRSTPLQIVCFVLALALRQLLAWIGQRFVVGRRTPRAARPAAPAAPATTAGDAA